MIRVFDNCLLDFIYFYIYSTAICAAYMFATLRNLKSKIHAIPLILINTMTYCAMTRLILLIPFFDQWSESSARLIVGPVNYIFYLFLLFKGNKTEKLFTLLLLGMSTYIFAGIWSIVEFLLKEQYNSLFLGNIVFYTIYHFLLMPGVGWLLFLQLNGRFKLSEFLNISKKDRYNFFLIGTFSSFYTVVIPNIIMFVDVRNGFIHTLLAVNSMAGYLVGMLSFFYIYLTYGKILTVFQIEKEKNLTEQHIELTALKIKQSEEHRQEADNLAGRILGILEFVLVKIEQRDMAAAINSIDDGTAYFKTLKRPISTGSRISDYFIYKTQIASDALDIEFSYECAPIPPEMIDELDFCTIISNILDNAVNACGQAECRRFIHLKIHNNNNILSISCENSKQSGAAERPRSILHGHGLSNVRECVEKYKGDVQIDNNENTFAIYILLYV